MTSIKNELIGTWTLLSYIEVPINGTDSIFPMGKNPKGILIYGADDYMSVQISAGERVQYSTSDRFFAPEEEVIAGMNSYVAYCGKFEIDNYNAIVTYDISTSLYPNWEGQRLTRKAVFDGDILCLKSVEPVLSNKLMVNSYLTWQRVEKSEMASARERFMDLKQKVSNQTY